jgi:hypothetical protein
MDMPKCVGIFNLFKKKKHKVVNIDRPEELPPAVPNIDDEGNIIYVVSNDGSYSISSPSHTRKIK